MKSLVTSLFFLFNLILQKYTSALANTNSINMGASNILVTGANTGIGLALCKQLVKDHGARVFLGSRNAAKGAKAVEEVKAFAGGDAAVELVVIDVGSDESVQAAANTLQEADVKLNAIVNNAGRGISHGTTSEEMINVNLFGPKRVVDAFLPLLEETGSRIVNTGSGAGPIYVSKQKDQDMVKLLCSPDITWEQIVELSKTGLATDDMQGYGLSKALLAAYTQLLAKKHPNIGCFCLSPGFIDTAMTAGYGAAKKPEEGTVSLRHCLFDAPMNESGWFFGSDAKRSPLHVLRNPGEPVFDGVYPWESK